LRDFVHHLSKSPMNPGSGMLMLALCNTSHHTYLAYGHCVRMWSTLSSTCKHVNQASGCSWSPCVALLSEVQSLFFNASHMKNLHFIGAKDFQTGMEYYQISICLNTGMN
jgi:hypothetical protein